jgi:hypothetical protein
VSSLYARAARHVIAALLVATRVRADGAACPVPPGADPTLAARDARARIDFLHHAVAEQARYAQRWKWGWVAVGLGTVAYSVAQVVGWSASSSHLRDPNITDNAIIAVFAVATPISAFVATPRAAWDGPALYHLFRDTAEGTAGTCEVLARAEEILAKEAAEEARNAGWVTQLTGLLGVGALFGILAVEAETASAPDVQRAHWQNAILTAIGGLVLIEAQIVSQPTSAEGDYRRYLNGDLRPKTMGVSVTLFQGAPGVSIRLSF